MVKVNELELLAPARNAEIAIEAILHGADAVYMGASNHGARAAAGNSLEDIRRVVQFAHQYGAKVYVTVNTIVRDDEIAQVEQLIADLYTAEVDALIVQDMGILRMNIPPIALHASTQCDIRTPEKARFLADAGFEQIVLARELSLEETVAISREVPDVKIEAFVHGALCVSYSGNCQAGWALAQRSANRGECPQICRQLFDLVDGDGRVVVKQKHLLSLRDLNRLDHLSAMIAAGVSSFKIEGRLKDERYVKSVVAAYRQALDGIIAQSGGTLRRSSWGESVIDFTPDLNECFNRGYTDYFTKGVRPAPTVKMASIDSPKWIGTPIGKALKACNGTMLAAQLTATLANGDGIGYFDAQGRFCGVRVNRVNGHMLHLASAVQLDKGTPIYRNHNKVLADRLSRPTATRSVALSLTLRPIPGGVALDVACQRGASATVSYIPEEPLQEAKTPQEERRESVLRKTGDTIYTVTSVEDGVGNRFIPVSVLADLRRRALQALERSFAMIRQVNYRREAALQHTASPKRLTYHDNVSNHLAHEFYTLHGSQLIEPALEVDPDMKSRRPLQVMATRYCLRRELGACLRTPQGAQIKAPLTLRCGASQLSVEFDCNQCEMKLFI